jgi:hypothetical protein
MTTDQNKSPPEYDAILKNARWTGKSISGFIYGDRKGRFRDGTFVHTSSVSHGYGLEIYHTRNSVYKVEWAEDAHKHEATTTANKSPPQHTGGPWHTDPETEHQSVLGQDGFMVADCAIFSLSDDAPTEAKCQANARLVAAAPDLLAALEYVLTECGDEWIDRARAAVSKATGVP